MAHKPLRSCNEPLCPNISDQSYCPEHRRERNQQRGSASQRLYDAQWRTARESYLRRHPLCVECDREGRVTPATVVDHIIPHKGDVALFWDVSNWQSMCAHHHNVKTATEDGGFGRLRPPRFV